MSEDLSDDVQLGNFTHNKPPAPATLIEKLRARQAELTAMGSAWLKTGAAAGDLTKADLADADRLAGYRKQVRELKAETEDACKDERKPHLDAAKKVTALYDPVVSACEIILGRTEPIARAWLKEKQRRIDAAAAEKRHHAEVGRRLAEELARQAEQAMTEDETGGHTNTMASIIAAEEAAKEAERTAKEAARATAERAKAGGQFTAGGVKRSESLVTVYTYAVADRPKALAFYLQSQAFRDKVDQLLISAARADHAGDRSLEIPGIDIKTDQRAR